MCVSARARVCMYVCVCVMCVCVFVCVCVYACSVELGGGGVVCARGHVFPVSDFFFNRPSCVSKCSLHQHRQQAHCHITVEKVGRTGDALNHTSDMK